MKSNVNIQEISHQDKGLVGKKEGDDIWPKGMKIVNGHLAQNIRSQGMIQEPNHFGYIHLAAEVESPHPFKKTSPKKKALLQKLKEAAQKLLLEEQKDVQRADVFNSFIIPPGSKEGLKVLNENNYTTHIARFDIVILIECPSVEAAVRIRKTSGFKELEKQLEQSATYTHCITAKNPKRIAEVDKSQDGVFLFNYFFAADIEKKGASGIETLLGVWEYTAGWWTAKANLTNSTPLQPIPGEHSEYSLINHCRWDRKRDIFPHLILRPTLEKFVLKNFTINDIVAMPILYHLA